MDLINSVLNVVFPPLSILFLLLISPIYLAFKLLGGVIRRIRVEDVTGKVVVVTGAASGIGEQLAYEYARRGARLALVDRREDGARAVAEKSRRMGSPDVIVICADVSDAGDCKRFLDDTIRHFGQLDHLVNNAGVAQLRPLENYVDISEATPLMDVNFWGAVYATNMAIPHLKKTRGRIIVTSSVSGRVALPELSIYGATKAAITSFYETLRMELGSDVGITIVFPGFIRTEIVSHEYLKLLPRGSAEACARAIVKGACRGERCVVVPSWYRTLVWLKATCPELSDWMIRLVTSSELRKRD